MKLRDSKTGPRTAPVGAAARARIAAPPGENLPQASKLLGHRRRFIRRRGGAMFGCGLATATAGFYRPAVRTCTGGQGTVA